LVTRDPTSAPHRAQHLEAVDPAFTYWRSHRAVRKIAEVVEGTKMRRLPIKAALVVGAAGAVLAAGSGFVSASAAAPQHVITYKVTKYANIHGPSHFRPGVVKFHITGAPGEAFQLVKTRHGLGRGTLVKDVATMNQKGDPKPLEHDFQLRGGASTGSTLFLTLEPGKYYAADTSPANLSYNKIRVIFVSGRTSSAYRPPFSGTITAIHEMTWAKNPTHIPASGYLHFLNKATAPHFIVLTRIKAGKTIADVRKALQGKEKESDVAYSGASSNYDSGVLSPYHGQTTSYSLHPGTYALMCFWPDDETGVPHAVMGMVRSIKVG
jgi:hypothetical protein